MNDSAPDSTSCYSEGERAWMERTQAWRARLFGGLLRRASRLDLRADHVTAASVLVGVAFPFLLPGHPVLASMTLGLHVLLDGFDGPLARAQGVDSPRGSFTDTIGDQVVLLAVTIGWLGEGWISGAVATAHLFAYHTVVLFAMARSALGIPFSWLVRPRFILYAAGLIQAHVGVAVLEPLHLASTGFLALVGIRGFCRLRSRL